MIRFALLIFAGYFIVVAIVYLTQGRLLYLPGVPGRELTSTPADRRMEYDDVNIRTSDGVSLHGWYVHGPSDRVLLFFHGNAGNISHRLDSIQQFRRFGLSVFIIDYRGYGKSEGRPTEAGLYLDGEAAWQYLVDTMNVAPSNIVVFGRSLGGSVAASIAARYRPAGLIIESAFTSVPDIAREIYPWLPVRWLVRMRHPTRDLVANVEAPVLVIHSRGDEIIPFHHGREIFEAAAASSSFLPLSGSHNDAFLLDSETYLQGIGRFLESLPLSSDIN